jgi:hypothetical protein
MLHPVEQAEHTFPSTKYPIIQAVQVALGSAELQLEHRGSKHKKQVLLDETV